MKLATRRANGAIKILTLVESVGGYDRHGVAVWLALTEQRPDRGCWCLSLIRENLA